MPLKTSEYLPKLILPSDDPGEKLKNKLCKTCLNKKIILEIEDLDLLGSQPCPDCSPTPDHFRSFGLL